MFFSEIIIPGILCLIISFLLTPLTIWFYKKKNWIDNPKIRNHPKDIHTTPVPRGGGIPIFLSIAIICLFFLPLDKHLLGILTGGLILMITGIIDDIYDIHPNIRLLTGFLAAGCVVASGIGIPYISNPFGEGIISLNQPQIPFFLFDKLHTIWIVADIFALIWIVRLINFVN